MEGREVIRLKTPQQLVVGETVVCTGGKVVAHHVEIGGHRVRGLTCVVLGRDTESWVDRTATRQSLNGMTIMWPDEVPLTRNPVLVESGGKLYLIVKGIGPFQLP